MRHASTTFILAASLIGLVSNADAETAPAAPPIAESSPHASPLPADYDLDTLIDETEALDRKTAGQTDLPDSSRPEMVRLKTIADAVCRARPVVEDELAKEKCKRVTDKLESVQQRTNTSESGEVR